MGFFLSLPLAGRVVCAKSAKRVGDRVVGLTPSGCCAATSPVKGEERGSSCVGPPSPAGRGEVAREKEGVGARQFLRDL